MAKKLIEEICDTIPVTSEDEFKIYRQLRCLLQNRFAAGTRCKISLRQEWFLRTASANQHVVFVQIALPIRNMLRDLDTEIKTFLKDNDFTVYIDDETKITLVRESGLSMDASNKAPETTAPQPVKEPVKNTEQPVHPQQPAEHQRTSSFVKMLSEHIQALTGGSDSAEKLIVIDLRHKR